MEITEDKTGSVIILILKDRLDANTSDSLQEKLFASIDGGADRFAVNFVDLDYISSAGLRVLLLAMKKLKSIHGKIVRYALREQIQEVFDIAGFSPVFPFFDSREEALGSFD